ncbi:MAG: excinuclease ABC subunit UvrC [Planctomycetes bacterium]|nr:excinuclease ABC subunit UvrC [Planctomycetota bacterium]
MADNSGPDAFDPDDSDAERADPLAAGALGDEALGEADSLENDDPFAEVAADRAAEAELEPPESETPVEVTDEDLRGRSPGFRAAAEKVRKFPHTPGVYLMKDAAGVVIYIGKAVNLRNRAGSYFLRAAAEDRRTAELVREIADIDFLPCDSEVDALLAEARLVKDVQPKYNRSLKDGKSFPYLQIHIREDFPRVEFTRQPVRGAKLYGPFPSAGTLRGAIQVLQKIFKFRTCSLDIEDGDQRWRWFRPCLLASINQCTAPCNLRISKEQYKQDIARLRMFLDGNKKKLLDEMRGEMQQAAAARHFEKAARLRDDIQMLETIDRRGRLDTHAQPEVFYIDPKRGLAGLKKLLNLPHVPRTIEGVDIAHLGGDETVASLVQFIDGVPFKPGYRRYKIRGVQGIDDFSSIHEVVARRFQGLQQRGDKAPDILLIDGGRGQLNAGLAAFKQLDITPPAVISLAKREEEVYLPDRDEPLRPSRHAYSLRLLQYVRDEAHRFAQHYHHLLRKRTTFDE